MPLAATDATKESAYQYRTRKREKEPQARETSAIDRSDIKGSLFGYI